ncbi:hypothetical protein BJX68DRAFT_128748 [Aspergillus pseudodeflectus]|uniref:Ubiquitin-like protease family profile domain-containing protein n=1 Tax=Aspergillus pseudodeflectus TaxID=176178 RepID=A0ABR4K0Y6_9EURO
MQFLKRISDQVLNRTPQPSSELSQPADNPLPSSDAAAAPPVRDDLFSVPPGSDYAPFDGFSSQSAPHGYANRPSTNWKSPSVRRLLRRSTPHSGLGMPTLPWEKEQMRKPNDSTRDELRLFGYGNGKPEPNAVPIVPGQMASTRKPNIPSGFKPVDKISKGVRQSGPVRAQGKERLFHSQPRSALSPPRSNHIADISERSSKRRRIESPEVPPKRISISDDDPMDRLTTRGSPVGTRSTALSPTPSQRSGQMKWPRDYNNGQASEYRNVDKTTRVPRSSPRKEIRSVDRYSSEDKDIRFLREARDERRRESSISGIDAREDPPNPSHEGSNLTVEIPSQPLVRDSQWMKTPQVHIPSIAKGRPPVSRESPDELQGGATVQPVPSSLDRSKRDQTGLPNQSSPSDIRPTTFASIEKRGRKPKKGKRPASETFRLNSFRTGPHIHDVLGGENDLLVLDPSGGKITITVGDAGIRRDVFFRKILRVLVGDKHSRKLRLELSKESGQDNKMDIELLTSDEKALFSSMIQKLNELGTRIEVQEKKEEWLDKVFNKGKRDSRFCDSPEDPYKRPLQVFDATEEAPRQPCGPRKRARLSDALRGHDGITAAEISVNSGGGPAKRASPSPPATQNSQTFKTETAKGVEIPVKKYNPVPQPLGRATRSMARRTPTTLIWYVSPSWLMNLANWSCSDDDDIDEDHNLLLDLDVDAKWNRKPLVYPRYGKKKAEVSALDLERLAPHQFLNDNIIGLYMRFLEDHLQRCNVEVAKRVYFFNSYFFATLTNSPRGKRTINYEGVEKWTRNVDLFSFDYIVVPINEDAHWYVVIICNLPYLDGISKQVEPSTSRPPSEVREVPETPEPIKPDEEHATPLSQSPQEEVARQSLASMILSEKQAPQAEGSRSGEEDWPEREEYPGPSCAYFSASSSQPQPDSQVASEAATSPKKGRKPKKKVPLGPKYEVSQPIIITFDSLGAPRTGTISTLKDYLYAEAKSKRGTEINKTLIKGMKAREVPQQPNYSDCGLYLLAYIEKFVQDPDQFVKKLLRKEMRSEDWPKLRSNLLRSRLREFMEKLYSEQEKLTKDRADESGLMVDLRPISYLLESSSGDDAGTETEAKKSAQTERSKLAKPKPEESPHRASLGQEHGPELEKVEKPNPIELEAQGSVTQTEPQDDLPIITPQSETRGQPRDREIIEVPDSQDQANAPVVAISQRLESGPSSPAPKLPKRAESVYIDDSDGVETTPTKRTTKPEKSNGFEVQIQVKETPPASPTSR